MSNLNKWDRVYGGMVKGDHGAFGNTTTYERAHDYLLSCAKIEDRGCGRAFFSTLFPAGQVISVDGTNNPHVNVHADLAVYRSKVPGIMMRHVLEHNFDWQKVVTCALESFTERMVLVLYTPFMSEPIPKFKEWHGVSMEVLDLIECWGNIPVLSLRKSALEGLFTQHGVKWTLEENISSACDFKIEHMYYLQK